ncbi:MAG: hypothetical protein Q7S23_00470 [bacterium]|nr:hypothetical protein [bacterium]
MTIALTLATVVGCARQQVTTVPVPLPPAPSPSVAVGVSTIQVTEQSVVIDFAVCQPQERRVDVAFGSTTFRVEGLREGKCALRIGGEVEDPNWDGSLPTVCEAPASLGTVQFPKGQTGVDYSGIQQYCR